MKGLLRRFLSILRLNFGLRESVDQAAMIAELERGVDFKGTTLWALVLAIVVASIGLNVNSTAVIIGAMLISPLMGPIMGTGLAIGINDTALLKRSVRNVALAAAVSIATSALYFALSPLADAQSELLSRTRPTLYDVLIALAGGAAGVVASTKRVDRGNVLPGVAIATALMPPLCTAGYGLASGQPEFFFGALYLFVINSVFICLATLGIVRLLRFDRVEDLDVEHARRIRLIIMAATIATVVPSTYVAWQVVRESRFESAGRQFVSAALTFPDKSVINTTFKYGRDSSTIETTLIGRPLSEDALAGLSQQLPTFGLSKVRLIIHQSLDGDIATEQLGEVVRAGILEDLYKRNQAALDSRDARIKVLEDELVRVKGHDGTIRDATQELSALYPTLHSLMIGVARSPAVGKVKADSTQLVIANWSQLPSRTDQGKIQSFLRTRLQMDSLRVRHLVGP